MPQAQTFSSRQSEPTAQMTGEEKVWVAEGSLGLVRAVRATYFFARITAFFTGDAVGCQKTVMLFSRSGSGSGCLLVSYRPLVRPACFARCISARSVCSTTRSEGANVTARQNSTPRQEGLENRRLKIKLKNSHCVATETRKRRAPTKSPRSASQ